MAKVVGIAHCELMSATLHRRFEPVVLTKTRGWLVRRSVNRCGGVRKGEEIGGKAREVTQTSGVGGVGTWAA